jgi:TPR repeat protein
MLPTKQDEAKRLFLIGYDHEEEGRLDDAEEYYTRSMDLGSLYAKRNLAYLLYDTKDAPHEKARGARYWLELAECGDIESMVNIGNVYCMGRGGLGQSYEKGIDWFLRSMQGPGFDVEDARSMACFNLGQTFAHGWGVPKDIDRAALYFRCAIAYGDEYKGSIRAKIALGKIYEDGG